MKRRTFVPCLTLLAGTAFAAPMSDWVVYQQGSALELAVDRNAIGLDKDGLVRFVNQERFAERQHDKDHDVDFHIRRVEGVADCNKATYAFTSVSFYSKSNRHVWSQMYPVPRYAWRWEPVVSGSVAHAMMRQVCTLARSAPKTRTE
ncbi:surface-adhesin E family protein [Paludibacterium paludis]|uniref:Surface-adhesin protein E-like domain-containing protein n=1 Tax=Paludibacterium paludis TaxID=1225769 RepID=A0A918P5D9_9NEIS|nr:surface-adhesin E family protein [Paludibacterium paludis]GGY21597.1 hypothetical protein GCM10011289_26540 [Paludibacterium paludis]